MSSINSSTWLITTPIPNPIAPDTASSLTELTSSPALLSKHENKLSDKTSNIIATIISV